MDWQTFLMEQTKDKEWKPLPPFGATVLLAGMVLRAPPIKGIDSAPDGKRYILVGNINTSGGTCSCCCEFFEEGDAEVCRLLD